MLTFDTSVADTEGPVFQSTPNALAFLQYYIIWKVTPRTFAMVWMSTLASKKI